MVITKSVPFTKNEKIIIESLAMDLLRVALGLHRGSLKMAETFRKEALKRHSELESLNISNLYLKKLQINVLKVLEDKDTDKSEDILMYSVLFQNFARKYYP